MPTLRDSEAVRGELAAVQARAQALAEREGQAVTELQRAQAHHGEMYATGADAATIRRQASAIGALRVELDGIGQGRALLAAQAEILASEAQTAQAVEALEAAKTARCEALEALTALMAYWRSELAAGRDCSRLSAAVLASGECARVAASAAAELNPERRAEVEHGLSSLWHPFPGLMPLMQAVEVFEQSNVRAEPVTPEAMMEVEAELEPELEAETTAPVAIEEEAA